MTHYVVRHRKTEGGPWYYLLPRKKTGRVYEARTAFGTDINQCRVFNNKTAARNSFNSAAPKHVEVEVVPVSLLIARDLL